jgi:hypothetical protein
LPTGIGRGRSGGADGGLKGVHEASASSSASGGARHNPALRSRSGENNRMWVVYLNVIIAVAIVAVFVVWTMRGRK